jgi:hypothetical protein
MTKCMKATSEGVAEDRGTLAKLTSVEPVTQRCGCRGRSTKPRGQEGRSAAIADPPQDYAGVSPVALTSRFRFSREL